MPRVNETNPETKPCPCCGVERPLDWFGPQLKATVYEKDGCRVKRTVRYRKYVACWKCREFGDNTELAPVPSAEADERGRR